MIIASLFPRKIGSIMQNEGVCHIDGSFMSYNQPFLIMREARKEEFFEQDVVKEAVADGSLNGPALYAKYFYEVSTD